MILAGRAKENFTFLLNKSRSKPLGNLILADVFVGVFDIFTACGANQFDAAVFP